MWLFLEVQEGIDKILVAVNEHNDIIYDKIVPTIFEALYRVNKEIVKENVDVKLLKKPKEGGAYWIQRSRVGRKIKLRSRK